MIENVRTKNHTEPSKIHHDGLKVRKRMITLTPYQPEYRQSTLKRIEAFWGFHRDLVQKTEPQPEEQDRLQLEDVFVDEAMRGQGIASQAILLAEQQAQKLPGIEAMTLQVVTRNEAALKLYHKLGYDTMSMVTLRKEFGQSSRRKSFPESKR